MDDVDLWCAQHGYPCERVGIVVRTYLRMPFALARTFPGSPDAATLLGVAAAAGSVWAYGVRAAWLAGLLVLLSAVLDSVDGALAALRGRATTYGAVLDSTADRVSDLLFFAGPALYVPDARPALVAAGAGTFLLEYVRARSQAVDPGWSRRITPGERPFRVIATVLLALAPDAWEWGGWVLAGLTALGALTLLNDARATSTTRGSG